VQSALYEKPVITQFCPPLTYMGKFDLRTHNGGSARPLRAESRRRERQSPTETT